MVDLKDIITNKGEAIEELSMRQPILLVFLRHFGCVFCREALHDLADLYPTVKDQSLRLVFVHMSAVPIANHYFEEYGLKGVSHISDPLCELYQKFELTKGSFTQLFGFNTWVRGFEARKKGINWSMSSVGDSFQMPGIFAIKNGKVVDSYVHKRASDRPDYNKLFTSCTA